MTHTEVMTGMVAPGLPVCDCPGRVEWKRWYPLRCGIRVNVIVCKKCHARLEAVDGAIVAVKEPIGEWEDENESADERKAVG